MSEKKQQPVIKKALGDNWNELADVIRRHYDITPGESSGMIIRGVMDEVYHSAIARLFIVPGRIFGALVPYKGKKIPTEVRNWTTGDNNVAMFWHRTLQFPNKSPVIFKSRMEHTNGDEIIEYVRYGMGIRMRMSVKDGALVFRSMGYIWKMGGIKLSIPTWAILGVAEITEKSISDDQFYIDFQITHPLFGRTFAYSGRYTIETVHFETQAESLRQ